MDQGGPPVAAGGRRERAGRLMGNLGRMASRSSASDIGERVMEER
jgi:hypothetical protein